MLAIHSGLSDKDDSARVSDFGDYDGYHILGGEGDDRIVDDTDAEVRLSGEEGNDTLIGGSDTELFGHQGNDVLKAGIGGQFLSGGAGRDRMYGGSGGDTFIVDNVHDQVFETWSSKSGQTNPIDTVIARVSFTLGADARIETIEANGSKTVDIHGNKFSQAIEGNATGNDLYGFGGNDTLIGGRGSDLLDGGNGHDLIRGDGGQDELLGGLGNDTLTGGAGSDTFVFDTALGKTNVDRITDFRKEDVIHLDDAAFLELFGGRLHEATFAVNKSGFATDKMDRVIYETDTGKVFYDADGKGGANGVHFATLESNLTISSSDFFVM